MPFWQLCPRWLAAGNSHSAYEEHWQELPPNYKSFSQSKYSSSATQRSHFISRALHGKKNVNAVLRGGAKLYLKATKMEVSGSHLWCNLQQLRYLSKLIKTGHLRMLMRGNITPHCSSTACYSLLASYPNQHQVLMLPAPC